MVKNDWRQMTSRDFYKELHYSQYFDMEDGNDTETICYPSLICIIGELCSRVEELERRLDKQEEYQQEQMEQ